MTREPAENKRKTLVVFTNGPARDARTWSNVPYMFLKSFERIHPDVLIETVDIRLEDSSRIVTLMAKAWNHFVPSNRGPLVTFNRTRLYHALVRRRMGSICKRLLGEDAQGIFLSFDFSNLPPSTKGFATCLLCDWTIEYEITEHQHRKPTKSEMMLIRRQRATLGEADHVVSLFPHSAATMEESSPGLRVGYFGLPGNVADGAVPNFDRSDSRRLVFIGGPAYRGSLCVIIEGLQKFNESHPDERLALDVIGMDDAGGGLNVNDIKFHGYLRKDTTEESRLFYDLVRGARALIAVSDRWVGASSLVEAMMLGTPVIVTPNAELREMFRDSDFGCWCGCSADDVAAALTRISSLTPMELNTMCHAAATKVHDMTWGNFVQAWCQWVGFPASR